MKHRRYGTRQPEGDTIRAEISAIRKVRCVNEIPIGKLFVFLDIISLSVYGSWRIQQTSISRRKAFADSDGKKTLEVGFERITPSLGISAKQQSLEMQETLCD